MTETVQAGWTPTVADPVCSNGDRASNITLAAGETVVCVFVNLKQDTIVVEKRAIGDDGTFAFTSQKLGAFELTTANGAASQSFNGLQPGTYSIAESVPAGWDLTSATCDNGATPDNISLAPGETVRCTFENAKRGSITVVKQTTGGDGDFAFAGDLGDFSLTTTNGEAQRTFTGLAAGTYSISESVPAGWDLADAACSDGSDPSGVRLAPGEEVT